MAKRLYKSATDKKLCGVCAGIGDYLNVDATVIRLIWLMLALTGTGILIYFIAAVIIPEAPMDGYAPPPSNENFN